MSKKTISPSYTVALLQMALEPDAEANVKKALAWTRQAAKDGAQVVCLPELYRTPYFCQREDYHRFDLAEPFPGGALAKFMALAKQLGVSVVVPFFERRDAGVYHNSAAVVDADGQVLGLYRKMHIPDDPGYYEKYYFAPGDLGFRAFTTRFGRVGVLICWDQWYPEAARLTALRGAEVLFYPTAIGWHPSEKAEYGAAQRDAWRTVQRGHAIANGVYVASVNRVGFEQGEGEGGIEFWGSSFIADPQGVILTQGPDNDEAILMAEIDLGHLETIRRNWPFLRDRRVDAYQGLDQRWLGDA